MKTYFQYLFLQTIAASEKFVEVFQNATHRILPCLVTLVIKRLVEGKMVYYFVSKVIVVDFHYMKTRNFTKFHGRACQVRYDATMNN